MRFMIIEGEKSALEHLCLFLKLYDPAIQIRSISETVDEPVLRFPGADGAHTIYRGRVLGRMGQKSFLIRVCEIAFASAENRIVHITTMNNVKYLVDHTLDELESQLDPAAFFRINRSMIIHVAAVEQVKPFINHRLRLVLRSPLQGVDIVISRERVSDFKKWADS